MGDQHTTGDDERRQREEALRAIAAQRPATPATPPAPAHAQGARPHGSRHRLVLALVALLLLGGGIFGWLRFAPSSGHPTTQRITLTFPDGALACASDAQWSPESQRIAVLGRDSCSTNGPWDSLLRFYDATSGKRLSTVDLGLIIQAQIVPHTVYTQFANDPALLSQVPSIITNFYGWSPDGTQVALQVGVDTGAYRNIVGHPRLSASDYWLALLLVKPSDGTARAVGLAPVPTTPILPSSGPTQPFSVTRWDLTTGTPSTLSLAPALAYTWGTDGTLRPTTPLPSTTPEAGGATPLAPPGNPDGGQRFSIWQQVRGQYNANYCSGAFLWTQMSVTPWSPDSRYLLVGINMMGRLIPPGAPPGGTASGNCIPVSQEGSDPLSPSALPALPIRDAGLRAALAAFVTQLDPSRATLLAQWDASGKRLAILNMPQFAPATLSLYDTASGRLLKQFTVTTFDPHYDPSASSFTARWSPDGTRLLIADAHVLVVLAGAEVGS